MSLARLRLFAFVVASFVMLAAVPAQAVEVGGLYEAVVPVSSQGAGERSRATAEGLRQVLVKVGGNRDLLAIPAIAGELAKADGLLATYRYESLPVRSMNPGAPPAQLLRIRLGYDPAGVLAILNRAGAPVWGANRPQVYLSVVSDAVPARTLFSLGTAEADVLIDAAAQRGLPVAVPAPGELAPAELPGATLPAAVAEAGSRAGSPAALSALLSPVAGSGAGASATRKWRARGILRIEDADFAVEATAGDALPALRELVAAVADRLGARYGVAARQDRIGTLRLTVSGVATLEAHAGLVRWLKSQPQVREVQLRRVEGDVAELELLVAGDVATLLKAMQVDGRFPTLGAPLEEGGLTTLTATLRAP